MANVSFRTKRPREISDLMMGLPAVICVVTIVPLLFFVARRERQLEYVYRQDAETAFANNDQVMAVICFDRLVRLRPNDADRLQLATWLRQTGQVTRSNNIMRGLAPEDKRGYGPAHLWFAKKIIESEAVDPESLTIAISHLIHARGTERDDGEVDFLLATCYWATGSYQESLQALNEAAGRDPAYYHNLFRACQQARLLPAASTSAKLAADYLKPIVAENPLDRDARQKYVECQIWLNEFKIAETTLRQGMKVDPDGAWHKVLANAYLAQFKQTKSEGLALADLLSFLEKAIAADSESAEALKELTNFGVEDGNDRIDSILENVLTSGRHTAVVHFILGSRQFQRGESGLLHMKQAYQLNKNLVFAANNLAYQEMLDEDGDFEAGLNLISDVLQKLPNNHAFRETRGQLLTRLDRFEEALGDLEYALAKFPDDQKLHESLSHCYQELGQPSLAKRHSERARRIRDRL